MHRGDRPVLDTEPLVDNLHHRGQAIGRATRRREQVMPRRLIKPVIHTHHDVLRTAVLYRRGHDHLLHSALEIRRKRRRRAKFARTLQYHVNAVGRPGHLRRLHAVAHRHPPVADLKGRAVSHRGCRLAPTTLHGVKVKQMRTGGGIGLGIVDQHPVEFRTVPSGAIDQPPDAAESVDGDANRFHGGKNQGQQAGPVCASRGASFASRARSRRNTGFSRTQSCRQARLLRSSREGLAGSR